MRAGEIEMAGARTDARPERSQMLVGFRRRDADAVRALYREYGHLVYAVAFRILGRHDLAEDAAQQTFVNAWRGAGRIDVSRDPAPWLATIAKRAAIDIYRHHSRRPAVSFEQVSANERAQLTNASDPEALDTAWQVRRAIASLSPSEATIIRLHHLDGLSHKEISEQLGIALGTVKSRSHRAHRRLVAWLGPAFRASRDGSRRPGATCE